VLLDAFGTLVSMERPAPRLRAELARRTGLDVSPEAAEAAFRAEIAFYLEHHLEGRDPGSLEGLRDRCAAIVGDSLDVSGLEPETVREAMLAAIRFEAQPDAPGALRALRARGIRLVVASNWDCSLGRVLADAGLLDLLDGVVSSAVAGAAKPDPAIFEAALEVAATEREAAVHVGDSPSQDVAGARAAGVSAILLDRQGDAVAADVPVVRRLDELPSLLFGAA
jgi:putative hydrolase of the HAD superfamily